MERPQVWKDTLNLSRDFPLFGVGLGNFQTIYPKYKTLTTPTLWEHAHNDYVEMLADTGWVGLLLFFGGIWFLLFSTIKKWKQRRDPFPASITLGGFIGAISLLCHCLVEFNLHIPSNAFLLFVILGLSVVAVNHKVRGGRRIFSPSGPYPLSLAKNKNRDRHGKRAHGGVPAYPGDERLSGVSFF